MLILQLAYALPSTIVQKYQANAQMRYEPNKNYGHSELPQVATQGNNVYVVWLDDILGGRDVFFRAGENTPENNGQIFFSKSNDGGNTFSDPVNLGNNTGFSGDPEIAASKSNYVYAVWHNAGRGIVFRRSTDGGNRFDKDISLSNNSTLCFQPQLAVSSSSDKDDNNNSNNDNDDDTDVYVAWIRIYPYIQDKQQLQEQQQNQQDKQLLSRYDVVFRRSIDKGETFGTKDNIKLANNISGFAEDLRLAALQNNVYAMWTNGTFVSGNYHDLTDIVFTKSFDNGNKFDSAVNINNYTGWSSDPQVAVVGNNVYTVWNENPHDNNGQIMFRRSNDNGTTFENKIINLSNNTEADSFDQNIVVTTSTTTTAAEAVRSKNNVNDNNIYVIWNANTTNGGEKINLRRSTDGRNTFENIINLSSNIGNSIQSAQDPQIGLSKSNNSAYVVWDANSLATNSKEIFLKQVTRTAVAAAEAMPAKNTTIAPLSSYKSSSTSNYGNKSATLFKELYDDRVIVSENGNKGIIATNSVNSSIRTASAPDTASKIALIKPTFTKAAYDNAFYIFYKLNANKSFGTNITKHIGLLSNTIESKKTSKDALGGSSEDAIRYLADHIKWLMPNSNVTVLADQDVHNGYIFENKHDRRSISTNTTTTAAPNTTSGAANAYDVIILGHQEYVTEKEYDNLKQFVANGGTLFAMDGNVLYSEVKYDNKSKTVTLTKGHNWEFNGKLAQRSIAERWNDDISGWIGGKSIGNNFDIIFYNNPFGYEHREEQYITNPKDKILLDYNASVIIGLHNTIDNNNNNYSSNNNNNNTIAHHSVLNNASQKNEKIAKIKIGTYELDFGKGKVISLGIYADDIIDDLKFNKFLDSLLFKYALKER